MKFSASVKIKAAFTIFKWVLFTNKWWSSSSFLNYWFIPSNFLCHYTLNEWYFDNKWYMILLHFTFLHLFGKFWTEHCFPLKAPTCNYIFLSFWKVLNWTVVSSMGMFFSIKLWMICSRVSQFGAFEQFTLHSICSYCITTWISFNNEMANY